MAHNESALIGRREECARIDRLLAYTRTGRSSVLTLRGPAGTGKTALLDYAAKTAADHRVVRAVGVESEMELPFAGLHQLCGTLLDDLEQLPPPQRDALGTAFGLSTGRQPDRFLIGLAVLSLLSGVAEERPLLCVVDDAQWLDRSSALVLTFVARRLHAESVLLLFSVREPAELDEFAQLPALWLEALTDAAARQLLASVIGAPLDEQVRERILAEARGNPLALIELPNELTPGRLVGGFGPPQDVALEHRIEASFRRRVEQLPTATQLLLLLAAADPTGEPSLLWRAAAALGISSDAAGPAIHERLLELATRVAFCHPLLRSAVYQAASIEDQRTAHRALAAATDAEVDPDRRAWHLAHAAFAPDEDVAAELERSAGRAQARGGLAAAGAFLERSAALTLDPGRRARRALEAAGAKHLAGAPQEALALVSLAAEGPLGDLDRAMLERLRGQIALDRRRAGEATPLLLDAARRLETLDPGLARETYLEAVRSASVAGRLGEGMHAVAMAARGAPPRPGPPRATDMLLDGLAVRFTAGYVAGAEALKLALLAVSDEDGRPGQDVRWPWIARRIAADLFDDDAWHVLATRNVHLARDNGALVVLPLALNLLALVRCFEGDLAAATGLLGEADEIAAATGSAAIVFGRTLLAGCLGDEVVGLRSIEAAERAASARGEGVVLTFGDHARAVLHNGLGTHAAAVAPAQRASGRDELMLSVWTLPELAEAACRCGRMELANDTMERLTLHTQAAATELALGIEARTRALVSDVDTAEGLYREALERLGTCRFTFDMARAQLLYGEWLRREQRRVDAREQLSAAYDRFEAMGAAAFAHRARRELLATGETVRGRTAETRSALTAQEAQIAQLARDGLSNPEIGARLFISPRTVQYHLRKVFTKLDISSRNQLHRALPSDPAAP